MAPVWECGIDSFSVRDRLRQYFRTLPGVFPRIVASRHRWGIFEWNPQVPSSENQVFSYADPAPYRADTELLAQYRPSVLVPFTWDNSDLPREGHGVRGGAA